MEIIHASLCGKDIPFKAKSYPYLHRHVIHPLYAFMNGGGLGDMAVGFDNAHIRGYEVLCLLAPNVPKYVPLHAFLGYPSEDAMEADDQQDFDKGFTLPDFYACFDAAIEVSGLKKLMGVTKFVDPQWARAVVTELLQDGVDMVRAQALSNSESSPSTKDGSDQSTSGTTTAPTPTTTSFAVSPSLASSL